MIDDLQLTTALETTARQAERCGFFFDFDGTLSPLQDNPATVKPAEGAITAISQLAALVGTIAVISGRPAGFLHQQTGELPISRFGLYGMEWIDEQGEIQTDPEVEPFLPVFVEIERRARAELDPSVLVEFKRLSVGLHFRTAPQQEGGITEWAQKIAAEYGVRALPGRMVIELAPPVHRDKGAVVRAIAKDLSCVWYFGDDLGDVPAMLALRERAEQDPGFTSVNVAVANTETVEEVVAAADIVVASPHDVVALLERVVAALRPTTA
ncbi:trehalose 6-phosphate phosphatase [Allocatelliglobosispora scoriae]|uniref:Trehalose 6-phosphate phosphatase n=1 Tax=Allocatelliglobosispora scoriae TaxID=643052 RepID=A0A841BYB9_9ACTN|nr:trehalose-phosphatase [Allocatelliglobosispora scoriae]MBB5872665.1 trehalose 6-phosphate phosphatase [Allocatelliglobosispora scoriae]